MGKGGSTDGETDAGWPHLLEGWTMSPLGTDQNIVPNASFYRRDVAVGVTQRSPASPCPAATSAPAPVLQSHPGSQQPVRLTAARSRINI